MTYEERVFQICETPGWEWTATWFRLGEVCVHLPEGSPNALKDRDTGELKYVYSTKKPCEKRCPQDAIALACSGRDALGRAAWIGWDFDVAQGKFGESERAKKKQAYQTVFLATEAAKALAKTLGAGTEIRLSKSGHGVHVRHLFPYPSPHTFDQGKELAKKLAAESGIKCDASSLGRQMHTLWHANPGPNGYKLIRGVEQ